MATAPLTRAAPEQGVGPADERLASGWIHAFTGGCVACVGLAFFFLDRSYGDFAVVAVPWLAATSAGFAAGAAMLRRDGPLGRAMCALLGIIGGLLAVFPTFLIYSLLRWAALCMLMVGIARAPLMRTHRDLYLTLLTCFVAAAVVAIHSRADWLLWVYLGPACLLAGLALTMQHVAGHAIDAVAKLLAGALFMTSVVVLACLLFLWLPRPPVLGFGFLPPATAEQGLAKRPGITQGGASGGGSAESKAGETGRGGSGDGSTAGDGKTPWQDMLDRMRGDLQDRNVPAWQRALLGAALDALGALAASGSAEADATSGGGGAVALRIIAIKIKLVWLLALLVATILLALAWWQRLRLAYLALNAAAWSTSRMRPLASMKLCARMMALGLDRLGSPFRRALTVREQLTVAPRLEPMERYRLEEALALYDAARFGTLEATAVHAHEMRMGVIMAIDEALAARVSPHRGVAAGAIGKL